MIQMKQILTIDELINHMKDKGIKFNIVDTVEAAGFLRHNNYYFKLAAYRCLYPKVSQGERNGEYQNLEFAYLQELSTIDMHIRYLIMDMCLDIEHEIKVKLVDAATHNQSEDGYEIVRQYLSKEDPRFNMLRTIRNHKSGEYCKNLITKYYPYFPIWLLVELISFGDLLHFCYFYEKEYGCNILPDNKLMNIIRDLRNASAHSNCLLNQLISEMEDSKQPNELITTFVRELKIVGSTSRRRNLHKIFPYDITTLLYVYNCLMPNVSRKKRFQEIHDFMNGRVIEHQDYFNGNSRIQGVYNFLNKIIDKLNEE